MPREETCFISHLHNLISNHKGTAVEWDQSGRGFIVKNLAEFTSQVLIRKFHIGRLDSFARKLNKYGFKRSKLDKNKIRFFHDNFNPDGKQLKKVKKLTKQETIPKHIKLRMMCDRVEENACLESRQDECFSSTKEKRHPNTDAGLVLIYPCKFIQSSDYNSEVLTVHEQKEGNEIPS